MMNAVNKKHAKLYKKIQDAHPAAEKVKIKASVWLISGCQDNQLPRDGDRNGLFTGTLKTIWNDGAYRGDYRKFHKGIAAQMPADQKPNYSFRGARNAGFQGQNPFTI